MRDGVRGVTIGLPLWEVVWQWPDQGPNKSIRGAHIFVAKVSNPPLFHRFDPPRISIVGPPPAQEYHENVNVPLAVPRHVTADVATLSRLINRSAAKNVRNFAFHLLVPSSFRLVAIPRSSGTTTAR